MQCYIACSSLQPLSCLSNPNERRVAVKYRTLDEANLVTRTTVTPEAWESLMIALENSATVVALIAEWRSND